METVAPHAGAWIETAKKRYPFLAYVQGAWIETRYPAACGRSAAGSHPTRVRGLKPIIRLWKDCKPTRSHPTRVRGLKP